MKLPLIGGNRMQSGFGGLRLHRVLLPAVFLAGTLTLVGPAAASAGQPGSHVHITRSTHHHVTTLSARPSESPLKLQRLYDSMAATAARSGPEQVPANPEDLIYNTSRGSAGLKQASAYCSYPGDQCSSNWAGEEVTPGLNDVSFAGVSGTWVVPTITPTSSAPEDTSTWIGLDGDPSFTAGGTLIQIGTDSPSGLGNNCPSGFAGTTSELYYETWFEVLPDFEEPLFCVVPGDTIEAVIVADPDAPADFWEVAIEDVTQGWVWDNNGEDEYYATPGSTAEWVEEDTTLCNPDGTSCNLSPLQNFGSVDFDNPGPQILADHPDIAGGMTYSEKGSAAPGALSDYMTSGDGNTVLAYPGLTQPSWPGDFDGHVYQGSPTGPPPTTSTPTTTTTTPPTDRAGDTAASSAFQVNGAHSGEQSDSLAPPLTELWSEPFVAQSYPLVADDMVFILESGDLVALNAATGSTVWGPVDEGGTPVGMTEDGGRIFVQVGGEITAYNDSTGAEDWSALLPYQWSFTSYPTAGDGYVYSSGAGSGGTLYALNEATGALAWTSSVENGDMSSPTVSGSGVYVNYACNQTYDFSPSTGQLIWHYSGPCEGGGGSNTSLHGGRLYAPGYPDNSGLVLNAASGTVVGPLASQTIPPAFSGGTEILNKSGTLNGEDAASGTVEWTFAGDAGLSGQLPVTDAGNVYVASGLGHLYALAASTGSILGTYDLAAPVSEPLAVGDNVLVVPTNAGVEVFAGSAPAGIGTTTTTIPTTSTTIPTTSTTGPPPTTGSAGPPPPPPPPTSTTPTMTTTTVATTTTGSTTTTTTTRPTTTTTSPRTTRTRPRTTTTRPRTTTTRPRTKAKHHLKPVVSIMSSTTDLKNHHLPIKLSCRGSACSGGVEIFMTKHHKPVALAEGTYALAAGHTAMVELAVTYAGSTQFSASKAITEKCRVTVHGGEPVTKSIRIS